jgi:hypothetical protein
MLAVQSYFSSDLLDDAELLEMLVVCERLRDSQSLNYHVTNAIRETPLLITKLLIDGPSRFDICLLDPHNVSKRAGKETTAKEATIEIASCFKERQRFINNIVRRDKCLVISEMKRASRLIIRIAPACSGRTTHLYQRRST